MCCSVLFGSFTECTQMQPRQDDLDEPRACKFLNCLLNFETLLNHSSQTYFCFTSRTRTESGEISLHQQYLSAPNSATEETSQETKFPQQSHLKNRRAMRRCAHARNQALQASNQSEISVKSVN